MVDAIVSFAVQRLGDFLIQEADFLLGVHDEVVWVRNELKWMQSFLLDAEEKQHGDARVRLWIAEIREIAFTTQDVIDTFDLKIKGTGSSKKGLLSTSVRKCLCMPCKTELYDIGKEIGVLRKRLLDIGRKRESYGITHIGNVQEGNSGASSSTLPQLRRTISDSDEEQIVGLEDDIHLLKAKLLNEEPQRSMISILGTGGLGKTTLARKLYNSSDIKDKFNCHAWVYVSQDWSPRNLLEKIIKCFKKLTKIELEDMSELEDIERCLRELLKEPRYLVVIDDVWHTEALENLRRAFPDNGNGSRIIITTRYRAVAEHLDWKTYIHELQLLRPDESWELFCKKAFPDGVGADGDRYRCPPDMETLGRELVSKCDGLPLAIIVLGGLLSRKQANQWHAVKEHIWKELKNKSIHISSLLELSFKDLPHHQVKWCFLYLGLFPTNLVINADKLVSMWVAEGFIPQGGEGMDLEEIAEEYLKELIDRSLIQVVKSNWRTVTECRVHDLLRDLAVHKARDENFLHHSQFQRFILLDHSKPDVSTLLHSSIGLGFQLSNLRVLDLEGTQFYTEGKLRFADALGEFLHLRYLGLKDTDIDEVPSSIEKLELLQTLEASVYTHTKLPREICKLKQLRHLKGYFSLSSSLLKELANLQTIKVVQVGNRLREGERDKYALMEIASLKNLKYLSIWSFSDKLLVQSLQCRHLMELRILGAIMYLPEEMPKSLPNLQYLELSHSKLESEAMLVLERFPNLIVLDLSHRAVEYVRCTENGFPRLEFLRLTDNRLLKVEVNEKGMPRLRALSIPDSEKQFLPMRLRSLPVVNDLNRELEQIMFV